MGTKLLRMAGGALLGCVAANAWVARQRGAGFSFWGRVVVITGGSRGLGLVLARQLAREGAQLALLARDREELDRAVVELEGRGALCLGLVCDVTRRDDVERTLGLVAERLGRIDVLINNAGTIQTGPFEDMTTEDFERALAIHFWGPLHTTMAALPHMSGGRVVNISSIGGKVAFPHLLPYAASKFALVGLSDGLRAELRRRNVYVTTACPGLMRTGSPRNAFFKGQHRKEYAWFSIADSLPILSQSAESAARKILAACRRGDARVVVGWPAKLAVLANELMPETSANLLALVNRLLPQPSPAGGERLRRGAESESTWSQSPLTKLSRAAAARNNQQPAEGSA